MTLIHNSEIMTRMTSSKFNYIQEKILNIKLRNYNTTFYIKGVIFAIRQIILIPNLYLKAIGIVSMNFEDIPVTCKRTLRRSDYKPGRWNY